MTNRCFGIALTDLHDNTNKLDSWMLCWIWLAAHKIKRKLRKVNCWLRDAAVYCGWLTIRNQEISTWASAPVRALCINAADISQPRPLLLSLLAIGAACFGFGLRCCFWQIHIITLVFGASLIGVADDYAVHFSVTVLLGGLESTQGLRYILPGLFIGLMTNLLSYAGLGFHRFPACRKLLIFCNRLAVAW